MTRKAEHKKGKTEKAESKHQLNFEEPKNDSDEMSIKVPESETAAHTANTNVKSEETVVAEEAKLAEDPENQSVKAQTHARSRKKHRLSAISFLGQWQKVTGITIGGLALATLIMSGAASQYFKNKTMPNVMVAGVSSTAKNADQIKSQIEAQKEQLNITFTSKEKQFTPKLEEIGLQVNVSGTVEDALNAKRGSGIFTKLAFWKKVNVPARITVNNTLLNQYIETNLPELTKAPQDSQLQFDPKESAFVVTPQADGEGADTELLKRELHSVGENIEPRVLAVQLIKKRPAITEATLRPLVEPANELTQRKIILSGLGYSFRARPSDIATWLTPTPQKDGRVKLVVDSAKIQSYVDSVSKRISNIPVDRKVVKDPNTGVEVVLQEGKPGTELADKQILTAAITQALNTGQDTTQVMNITTANFQTVNMEAYEKWIEVDLSEQRTTAYERATPVKNFIISSGTKGHETVTGEFAIWHKNRKQTMQGGSRADGSYYSIPNVEWVSYFYKDYALHGAWWREKFGAPASHGCVNMTNSDAKWVYEWAPMGTKVIVHQ